MDRNILKRWLPAYSMPLVFAAGGIVLGLALGRLSLLNALLLIILAFSIVGSFLEPLIGVSVALFLGPMWAWLRAYLPQIPPLIGQYVFFIAIAGWIARGLMRRDFHIPLPPLLWSLLVFMSVALLSLWRPEDAWVGLWEWAKWGQILVMFLLVYSRIQGEGGDSRAMLMVIALASVGVFQAAIGVWQFAFRGTGISHFAIDERFYRAYGTFEQPNPFAGFLGMMGSVMAGIVLGWLWDLANGEWRIENREARMEKRESGRQSRIMPTQLGLHYALRRHSWGRITHYVSRFTFHVSRFKQALFIIPAALIAIGLIASWSRGAWMGFGAALLLMAGLLPRRGLWGMLLVAVVVVGGLALYSTGLLPPAIANRLTGFLAYTRFEDVRGAGINDANFAVLERMAHWQAALEMWRKHFWLGIGFGCYEPAYPNYRLINWPHPLGHAHNYYLNLLAETGLFGLGAYLLFLGCVFWGLWRASRHLEGWQRGLAIGLTGAWTHLVVHDLVDNILVNNVHLHLGVILALTACLMKKRNA